MSHEQMLAWLDEASSFYVQDAADRLTKAATKMRDIAKTLRDRPGRVEWKGEAEKAFMEWADSLASSTHSLADYSDDASFWMSQASDAIALAQSAIPRYTSHAQAKENLEAARKFHNDPDSQQIAANARSQMADVEGKALTPEEVAQRLAAKAEANRQAAADEMEKLSGSYQWSDHQMQNLVVPTLPPPPAAFVPDQGTDSGYQTQYVGSSASSDGRSSVESGTATVPSSDSRSIADVRTTPPPGDKTGPTQVVRPEVPADLGIDSVGTLPPPTTTTPPQTSVTPPVSKPDGFTPPMTTLPGQIPPAVTGGTRANTPPMASRAPVGPGRTGPGTTGPLGMPREGISGGRAVPPNSGRATTGIPRSTVIGTERGTGPNSGMGRGPMGGMGGTHPMGGQNGISGGRRLAVETGGVVGARPQQPGAAGSRPFTPGGSGLVRGGAQGESGHGAGQTGRGGMMHGGSQAAGSRRDERNGERPDYLVEDEETWQQGGRPVAPPVID
ncbi:hypothetical protein [Streptomyces sp. NPDC047434]|uniref:hypothetical protein n=1 Tax=Streptomyces sp. NPDC047434 TaxID=3155143 RepID=UPI00340FDA50